MFFKAHTHESRCQTERCSAFNNFLHHKKEQKLHEVASGQFITRSVLISQTSSRKPLAVFHPNTDYKIFPKDRWKFHINHEGNVLFAFHWRNLVSWSVMHVNARWKSDIDVQGEDSCSCSIQAFIEPPGLCCFLVMLLQSWNAIRTDMLYTHTHTHRGQETNWKLQSRVFFLPARCHSHLAWLPLMCWQGTNCLEDGDSYARQTAELTWRTDLIRRDHISFAVYQQSVLTRQMTGACLQQPEAVTASALQNFLRYRSEWML